MQQVQTDFLLKVQFEVTEISDLGPTPTGNRRIARVAGGEFEGPKLKGTAVPGPGGDWLNFTPDGATRLDVRVTLKDGSFHDVDSSEMAFKIAGSMGFRDGATNAEPVLLEPIMKVEVVTPEDYMGDVMGDLNRRRGLPQGMDETPAGKTIRAEVPLAEMFGYATDLRSMSQGRAVYSMEFEKYSEVPQNVADTVIRK